MNIDEAKKIVAYLKDTQQAFCFYNGGLVDIWYLENLITKDKVAK